MQENMKTCLVVTYGPVPTPEYQTIEGGGMRAWGLAKGLQNNRISVTVAVNNSFPQKIKSHEGINLVNWGQDRRFSDLINSYDAVIVSYAMGSDSVFIADNINDSVQLILDVYVPIYIEISARESKDMDSEYRNYMQDIIRFNRVLRRGDYFLCANEIQKTFYTGVLSAMGIINPKTYKDHRILVVPFGIHNIPAVATRNPYLDMGIKPTDFTVLWFGGLYPWFRVQELLDAVLKRSTSNNFKFVLVGGKNPFNSNPDFIKQYDAAYNFAKEHKLLGKSVHFVDWVDFEDRINWFKHASVVISLNSPGEENNFSWRTRVMDFVWGELAIVTNGGDPLSEELLLKGAAIRLDRLSDSSITKCLKMLQENTKLLEDTRNHLKKLKHSFYWDNITKPVAEIISLNKTPYLEEKLYKHELHVQDAAVEDEEKPDHFIGKNYKIVRKSVGLPGRIIRHAKQKGIKRSVILAKDITKNQVKSKFASRNRQYIFIGHHMDNTGAPVVLMQIIEEFTDKYGSDNIHLVSSHVDASHLRKLRELGVVVDKAVLAFGWRLISMQLNLRRNDFVLINTIATYENYRDYIFHELEIGKLSHAYWFIHEDKDQIPAINPDFLNAHHINRITKLINTDKLSVVTPSKRTSEDYNKIFNTKKVQSMPLTVDIPKDLKSTHTLDDYNEINFFLSGHPADGRKGQLIAMAAFTEFINLYYSKNPKQYRDFSLTLLSVGNDYISQQIKWIGKSLLGNKLKIYPQLPREKALEIASSCNATICCSLNETFGLYVAEGMLMGHFILRNNSAGMEEQLQEGVNGYYIDHKDIKQFADVIEKVLNKDSVSNKSLQDMGKESRQIITKYTLSDYTKLIKG
jgi:glycosyltransferase involved in cell wall biosynthesis